VLVWYVPAEKKGEAGKAVFIRILEGGRDFARGVRVIQIPPRDKPACPGAFDPRCKHPRPAEHEGPALSLVTAQVHPTGDILAWRGPTFVAEATKLLCHALGGGCFRIFFAIALPAVHNYV